MSEVEQEIAQDSAEESIIDLMNITSIHFNKNCSEITANLKMSVGINNIKVPYKIDTGNNGNIMPLHIYKKNYYLFLKITSEQLQQK